MMTDFLATDQTIKHKYGPLFREVHEALIFLLDDMDRRERGKTIVQSIDFYHMFDFMWFSGNPNFENYTEAANYWTFQNIAQQPPIHGLNLVASRGTVLEICDSLQHEIERLDGIRSKPDEISDLRKKYDRIKSRYMSASDYSYDYVSALRFFESKLPVFGVSNNNNVAQLIGMFDDKKIQSYYDIIPIEEIERLRPEINRLADDLLRNHPGYQRNRSNDRDPIDEEFHRKVDARNISISMILGDQLDDFECYHVTPAKNFNDSSMLQHRKSVLCVAYFVLACLQNNTVTHPNNGSNHKLPDPTYIHFLAEKVDYALSEMHKNEGLPSYIFDELLHIRKMLLSIFYKDFSMNDADQFAARRKLLMIEGTDKEIHEAIEGVAESYENAARKVLSDDVRKIDTSLLYDTHLIDNERAKFLMKKYS